MNDRTAIAWLHRRVGFGLAPGELDRLTPLGVDAVVDRLLAPDGHGVPADPDPWANLGLADDPQGPRGQAKVAIAAWLPAMAATGRPAETWLTWFWHGHFATSVAKVRSTTMMADQLRLFRRLGSGSFPALLRAVAIDPAMLVWLDGRDNAKGTPNENFAREVLELFSLGVGHYDEADVAAGAAAFSGWSARSKDAAAARFIDRRHDDTPHTYLGRAGVHDLDGAIGAIAAHDACAPFVAGRLARAVLGDAADDALVAKLATTFRQADLDLDALLRAIVAAGLDRLDDGADALPPVVLAPVPWLVAALRATGARAGGKALIPRLEAAGQVPMAPPNVGGWPGGAAWLGTSTTVARFGLAVAVAQTTPVGPVRDAAADGDDDLLADLLGRPGGFGSATTAALAQARKAGGADGVAPLVVALASPELAVA